MIWSGLVNYLILKRIWNPDGMVSSSKGKGEKGSYDNLLGEGEGLELDDDYDGGNELTGDVEGGDVGGNRKQSFGFSDEVSNRNISGVQPAHKRAHSSSFSGNRE